MKFDHRVKFKGILYEVGQDVPMEEVKAENKANMKPQGMLDKKVNEVESAEKSADKKSAYSKTEINRMSTADLKELAKSEGIDSELSGADIKKALINKFEL
jgi:hypothetical protein